MVRNNQNGGVCYRDFNMAAYTYSFPSHRVKRALLLLPFLSTKYPRRTMNYEEEISTLWWTWNGWKKLKNTHVSRLLTRPTKKLLAQDYYGIPVASQAPDLGSSLYIRAPCSRDWPLVGVWGMVRAIGPLARLWECSQSGVQNNKIFLQKRNFFCFVLQIGCIPTDVL